ncbi:SusD/RagB family nutrient-binding outer membrane lipoprotein [Sphingobacterium bambusae]|uniref:SusD/RagB family nutrient-binding outer membrane lipoprotein n=1 Tax=Sphingobacterium bambusae TaxID=662858 RepID=A0ABW6BDT6_9SPHI|nr:SusD/RagB family nutrient-binding outer membrane lipoprotein [Sphingobacterium bambusae]WPL46810.1 SusD/RagB family nutrient-binding outer membrane lipoprotein [Sphingobacterium bambusae]
MKKILYLLAILGSFFLEGCNKWLDINNNPNSANSTVPLPEQRLPSILAQFADGYESAGTRAVHVTHQLANVYGATTRNYLLTRWYSDAAAANWPWQAWYVNTAVNIQPMIEAAEKLEAYHYVGVGKIMKAWGFGYLADFYGILPYREFDNPEIITPAFDDAEYVYSQVIPLLDEAVVDLQKTQGVAAPDLSLGDTYNRGNVDNWIKLAYGLKARFLSHLNKKSVYDEDAILQALQNAPQTAEESTIFQYIDQTETTTSTAQSALQYVNTSASTRLSKMYLDYILNRYTGAPTGGQDMQDPRFQLLVPHAQEPDGTLRPSIGVDFSSDVVLTGPVAYSYSPTTNKFSNKDSVYVQLREAVAANGRVLSTGTWYNHKDSKGLLLTGAEMKFIEAEVRFRKGESALALAAYKEGIRIHMQIMDIAANDISGFLASSSVIQNASSLTLSHIMIQKYIALSYSPEQWVDMRRLNFCTDASGNYNELTGVYKGYKRPVHVYTEAYPSATDWPRRFAMATYEVNYNSQQLRLAAPTFDLPTYINEPIWWDKED